MLSGLVLLLGLALLLGSGLLLGLALLLASGLLLGLVLLLASEPLWGAAIYTQLSDVEDELNGLLTYDRAKEKLPPDKMRELFEKLFAPLE